MEITFESGWDLARNKKSSLSEQEHRVLIEELLSEVRKDFNAEDSECFELRDLRDAIVNKKGAIIVSKGIHQVGDEPHITFRVSDLPGTYHIWLSSIPVGKAGHRWIGWTFSFKVEGVPFFWPRQKDAISLPGTSWGGKRRHSLSEANAATIKELEEKIEEAGKAEQKRLNGLAPVWKNLAGVK